MGVSQVQVAASKGGACSDAKGHNSPPFVSTASAIVSSPRFRAMVGVRYLELDSLDVTVRGLWLKRVHLTSHFRGLRPHQ